MEKNLKDFAKNKIINFVGDYKRVQSKLEYVEAQVSEQLGEFFIN
jgi:hypothetical protein